MAGCAGCDYNAVFLLLRFIFLIGYVPTESMEPTLHQGCYILGIRCCGDLETGDIAIFEHNGRLLVKRIAAVGGEAIVHAGQELIVQTAAIICSVIMH